MSISMIGIDHSVADLEHRELFSFTKKSSAAIMEQFLKIDGVRGCVVLSTCNRMEIWISKSAKLNLSIYEELCKFKEIDYTKYGEYFVHRNDRQAVEHLFALSCGLKSKIVGEDQIVTQVKDALAWSRENYCTDNVLEVLFRMAITAAKKIKTDVKLSKSNYSANDEAIRISKEAGFDFHNKKCMVIGNGEMGKLTAMALINEGADVTVTVRQYRSGVVDIPKGCNRIDYSRRLELFAQCDLVASATSSPNPTLKYEDVREIKRDKPLILIDLAVPRDIEPAIGSIDGMTLYNIDNFTLDALSDEAKAQIEIMRGIIAEHIEEFYSWFESRDVIKVVNEVSESAATDVILRLHKIIGHMNIADEEKASIEESIKQAANKVVNKIMFGIKDELEVDDFRKCAIAAKNIYSDGGNSGK